MVVPKGPRDGQTVRLRIARRHPVGHVVAGPSPYVRCLGRCADVAYDAMVMLHAS